MISGGALRLSFRNLIRQARRVHGRPRGVLVVSDDAFIVLLPEPFWQTFTTRAPCDATQHREDLFALTCGSREAVDRLVKKAFAHGLDGSGGGAVSAAPAHAERLR